MGEGSVFYGSTNLSTITVDPLNPSFSSVDGILFNRNKTVLVQCPGGRVGSYQIPAHALGFGEGAFTFCVKLSAITVDPLNPNLSSVDGVLLNKSQTRLYKCPAGKAGSFLIPNTVTSIENSAFNSCINLTNVTIPESVTGIGEFAFANCTSLSTITVDPLHPDLSSVDGVLFDFYQEELIQCPGGKAGNYAIPNSVTRLGYYAFHSCVNLTSVTIPGRVTGLPDGAFHSCTGLTGVYFLGNVPGLGNSVFTGANNLTVYYLLGSGAPWGPLFAGRPALLWKPLVDTTDATFGVRTNQFGFTLNGARGLLVVVEASTNLANSSWIPVETSTFRDGPSSYFSDAQWANHPARFYRLRLRSD
jgi:hypothetical protein